MRLRNPPANIVESSYFPHFVLDHHEIESCHLILHEIPDIVISRLVRDEEPTFGKDCPPFQLIDGRRVVKLIWQRGVKLSRYVFL